ncbi:MAG: hypothetical protein ABL921_07950 [Pirellula sp.]
MNSLTTNSIWFIALTLFLCVGCDSILQNSLEVQDASAESSSAESSSAGATVQEEPLVPRVEYVNWSQFPIGTSVILVRETKSDVDQVIVTTTTHLAEKSEAKVVIETQITVDRNGNLLKNPPMQLEFPASFRLPHKMEAEKFSLPAPNAKATGEETVKVEGKDYKATVYTWTGSSEAGPTTNTIWLSDDIPGRVIKQDMACSAFKSQENLTKVEVPSE